MAHNVSQSYSNFSTHFERNFPILTPGGDRRKAFLNMLLNATYRDEKIVKNSKIEMQQPTHVHAHSHQIPLWSPGFGASAYIGYETKNNLWLTHAKHHGILQYALHYGHAVTVTSELMFQKMSNTL